CSRDHRHLHSFPTRRSSDLCIQPTFLEARVTLHHSSPSLLSNVNGCPVFAFATTKAFDRFSARTLAHSSGPSITPRFSAAAKWVDRKSTRLNSSHDQISYAV